jgi:hypothetical protein
MRRRRSRRQLKGDLAQMRRAFDERGDSLLVAYGRIAELEATVQRQAYRLETARLGPLGDTMPMAAVRTPGGWQPASSAPIPVPVEAPTEVLARVVDGDGADEMVLPWFRPLGAAE